MDSFMGTVILKLEPCKCIDFQWVLKRRFLYFCVSEINLQNKSRKIR